MSDISQWESAEVDSDPICCTIYMHIGLFSFCHVVPMGSPQAQEGKDLCGVCSLSPALELMPDTGPWVPKCLPKVDRSNYRVFWDPGTRKSCARLDHGCCGTTVLPWVPPVTDRMLFRRHGALV